MPRVEFVGLPSPFADPVIQKRMANRSMSKEDRDAVWRMEQKRQMQGFARFTGVSILHLTPEKSREQLEAKGITGRELSRTYTFGPNDYVVEMEQEDVETLMLMHVAHPQAFRILDGIVLARS